MESQKRINEAKFNRVRWNYEDGIFTGYADIRRQPFGLFFIYFTLKPTSEETTVEIVNYSYPALNRPQVSYENFTAATKAIAAYFDRLDEIVKNKAKNLKERARKAYQSVIAQEIEEIASEAL